jgi:hypothetical protein
MYACMLLKRSPRHPEDLLCCSFSLFLLSARWGWLSRAFLSKLAVSWLMCFISSREAILRKGDRRADVPIFMLHESFILDHGKRRHRRFASFARVDRSSFCGAEWNFLCLGHHPEEVNRVEPA